MKSFSIILTTYNAAKTIQQTLDAVFRQEGLNDQFTLELLAIDDGSTDDTVQILQKNGITYRQNERNSGGPNKGRNIGLRLATGDYICFLDHDDQWNANRLLATLPYLEQVPIVTAGYTVCYGDKEKKEIVTTITKEPIIRYSTNEVFLQKLARIPKGANTYLGSIVFCSSLRDVLFEEHFGMLDYDWILRLFHQQASIEISKPLYVRQVENYNLSLNADYRRNDFYYALLSIELYDEQYPRLVKKSYKRIHGSRARYYYLINDMPKARFFFRRAECSIKTLLYYVTTYAGSTIVQKKFKVFG